MDLLNTKEVYYKGRSHIKAFYGEKIVWSKVKGKFSKDLKDLKEYEIFHGILDLRKGALKI